MDDDLHGSARQLLRTLTGRADADFHDGQWEAIEALVRDHRRALVVQRTGWGKSAVYFIATRLLRDQGAGPTILLSPLLALMRNQIDGRRRRWACGPAPSTPPTPTSGPRSSPRSTPTPIDLLLISPERLANRRFRDAVLDGLGSTAGMVVIDEAHCISDWGHDFRPDYRRIRRILDLLPPDVPGARLHRHRQRPRGRRHRVASSAPGSPSPAGPLARDSLALHVIDLPDPARSAWRGWPRSSPTCRAPASCTASPSATPRSVTDWLVANGIDAGCYTGDSDGREDARAATAGATR